MCRVPSVGLSNLVENPLISKVTYESPTPETTNSEFV